MKYLYICLLIINAFAFVLMYADKQRAKKNRWRISEATLLTTAFFGGSIGALFGMYLFRHKTLHMKFTLGIPLILIFQLILAALLLL